MASYRTRRPTRMAGAIVSSGSLDTGEVNWTRGGQKLGTVWSGGIAPAMRGIPGGASSGNQVVVASGQFGGRLHSVIPLAVMQSGTQVWFYDAAVPARSGAGPVVDLFAESGARILGIIPTSHRARDTAGFQSGYGFSEPWQDIIVYDTPFYSGLHISCASGAPGFSFSYTLEASRSGQGDDIV